MGVAKMSVGHLGHLDAHLVERVVELSATSL